MCVLGKEWISVKGKKKHMGKEEDEVVVIFQVWCGSERIKGPHLGQLSP